MAREVGKTVTAKDRYGTFAGSSDVLNDESAQLATLADLIKEYVEEENPLSENASLYSDLLNSAIGECDWRSIAEHVLEDGPWAAGTDPK